MVIRAIPHAHLLRRGVQLEIGGHVAREAIVRGDVHAVARVEGDVRDEAVVREVDVPRHDAPVQVRPDGDLRQRGAPELHLVHQTEVMPAREHVAGVTRHVEGVARAAPTGSEVEAVN